jgi:mono/diheme cytochrome c family protein
MAGRSAQDKETPLMTHSLFRLAAATVAGLTLLTGCPAEERTETTTTTTTTENATPAPTAGSPSAPAGATSPAGSAIPASHVDAKAIFSQKCSGCHGANGGGSVGPALTNVEAKGDEHIKSYITNGSPNKVMPAFKELGANEVEALVTYVKTL